MNKQQANQKIQELEAKIAELKAFIDKPEVNVVTHWPSADNQELRINDKWAASILPHEKEEGLNEIYSVNTGRAASMFFATCRGKWYNEDGKEVNGYLYFEPAK